MSSTVRRASDAFMGTTCSGTGTFRGAGLGLLPRPRELAREEAIPEPVGEQRALADEHMCGRRDAVARARRGRRDRLLDRLGNGVGAAAQARRRPALVDTA